MTEQTYKLPSYEILVNEEVKDSVRQHNIEQTKQAVNKINYLFEQVDFNASVDSVQLAPQVANYYIKVDFTENLSKIKRLLPNLQLALGTRQELDYESVRGKVMIAVNNEDIETVPFKELYSKHESDNSLEIPLGIDIAGNVYDFNLSKAPHALIAGSTGSGKSVGLNTIIGGILMKNKPNDINLSLIDPKQVEFSIYDRLPNARVITDMAKAKEVLSGLVMKMDNRFTLLKDTGVKNIKEYNEKFPSNKLPYEILVIDELNDLMMMYKKEIENMIIRLAQLGRASGIHMLIATQKPDSRVLSTLIRSNLPTRIAFSVSTGRDSSMIIDQKGAEKLVGRGDLLINDKKELNRVQSAFISDDNINKIIDYIIENFDFESDIESAKQIVEEFDFSSSFSLDSFESTKQSILSDYSTGSTITVEMLKEEYIFGYYQLIEILDDLVDRNHFKRIENDSYIRIS